MKKISILLLVVLLQSCSVTIIYSEKKVCNHGSNNQSDISGSHLKENQFHQSADGEASLPLSP